MRALLVFLLLVGSPAAFAQFKDQSPANGPKLGQASTQRIRIGVTIKATRGSIQRAIATAPVPAEWPEQQVRIVNEDVSHSVKSLTYRTLTGGGTSKQMVVEVPQLSAGQEAHALITFEVTRRAIGPPDDPSQFVVPKKIDRGMMLNLGAAPYIESRHAKVISSAREAASGAETDWQKAEAIYNWIGDHVVYKSGEVKGAARAVYDKEGDVDALTSLFVAMCRAQKIPARTVFVLGHCYGEFYLEDEEGQGYWFPCQIAGERSFGASNDVRPILQKGDNFKTPEKPKERQRYVTEYFTAAGRGGEPKVEFVSELVAE